MKSGGKLSRAFVAFAALASFAALAMLAPGAHQHDARLSSAGPASQGALPSWTAPAGHGSDPTGPSGTPDSNLCIFCKWSRSGLSSPDPDTDYEKHPPVRLHRPAGAPRITDGPPAHHILLRAPPAA